MLFFKKKPENMPALGKGFLPTDRVKELSSKGFSEPEMIDILRKEGFSAEEIDKGLTEALRAGVTGASAPAFAPTPPAEEPKLPTLEEIAPEPTSMPAIPETSLPTEYYQGYSPEEYLDYVLRERMGEIDERIVQFMSKYGEVEKKMAEVHEELSLLSKARITESQILMSKIDSFKETIDDVSARVSSLEKAFKETLPALIESVRALCDLVQRFKREA